MPNVSSFIVPAQSVLCVAAEYRHPQPIRVQPPFLHQKLPGPRDSLFFEVIAKRPVAQHLKEGVMVAVLAHLLQIVMFTGNADAFLAVSCSQILRLASAQEDVLELIHTGIYEHQGRVVDWYDRSAGHELMAPGCEEIYKSLANCFAGRFYSQCVFLRRP